MKAIATLLLASGLVAQDRGVGIKSTRGVVEAETPSGSVRFGEFHALLVGIKDYGGHPGIPSLEAPTNDVQKLRSVLTEHYCFEPANITTLLNEAATRERILEELDRLARTLDRNDNLLIYYAGHGEALWRGDDWQEGYWVTWVPPTRRSTWWNWLSVNTLNRATARIPARNVLLISDSCYAKALLDRRRDVMRSVSTVPDMVRAQHELRSNQILTAGGMKPVPDAGRVIDGKQHSIFAWHLFRVLETNDSDFLPAINLASAVIGCIGHDSDHRRSSGRTQVPLFAYHPDDGERSDGQFVFVRGTDVDERSTFLQQQLGAPPGYRLPDSVVVREDGEGLRYFSREGALEVEMALVAAGRFRDATGAWVEIQHPFLIDKYEVTKARMSQWVNAGAQLATLPNDARTHAIRGFPGDTPAVQYSLEEMRAFSTWAGKRLPTQSEWEFAAAGVDEQQLQRFPWRDEDEVELRFARPNRLFSVRDPNLARDRSPWQVIGMGGGVREMCELEPPVAGRGIVRGGTHLRSHGRGAVPGTMLAIELAEPAGAQARSQTWGFRCVHTLIPPAMRDR